MTKILLVSMIDYNGGNRIVDPLNLMNVLNLLPEY